MSDYKKLKVWQYSHELALDTHKVAMGMRGRDYSSFRNQLIRASASIPANIVEGRAKDSDKDFSRFLGYAAGSASELEYHLILVRDLGLVSLNDAARLLRQIGSVCSMIHGLRTRLKGANPQNS